MIQLKTDDDEIMRFKNVEELLESMCPALNVKYKDRNGEWIGA